MTIVTSARRWSMTARMLRDGTILCVSWCTSVQRNATQRDATQGDATALHFGWRWCHGESSRDRWFNCVPVLMRIHPYLSLIREDGELMRNRLRTTRFTCIWFWNSKLSLLQWFCIFFFDTATQTFSTSRWSDTMNWVCPEMFRQY